MTSSTNPTAARWFVNNAEWAASTSDYAVVAHSAASVRSSLQDYDENPPFGFEKNFIGLIAEIEYRSSPYELAGEGSLVYADVNQADPGHRAQLLSKWARKALLEEKEEGTKRAAKGLYPMLVKHWENFVIEGNNEDERMEKVLKMESQGDIGPEVVDYILRVKDAKEREECLRLLSGQAMMKSPRKVLMLIGMLDSYQTEQLGVTQGWVSAYDLVDHELIIKPFVSKDGHHPLGDRWKDMPVDDGVSFRGTPATFTKKITRRSPSEDSPNSGFKMAVYTQVARWMLRYWDSLEAIKTPHDTTTLNDDKKSAVTASIESWRKALWELEFPNKEKAADDRPLPLPSFQYIQQYLEEEEYHIREDALYGREHGKPGVAERIAKLYGEMLERLRLFNEDPENHLPPDPEMERVETRGRRRARDDDCSFDLSRSRQRDD
ncbi:hypothetical protein MMC08_002585 [Hypocenomyce scalaris]|nr:hypothetical protein [Hypocenomyce scalaris]